MRGLQDGERSRRVSEVIRREVARLIAREVDDARVGMAQVTAVTTSRDLKRATVYVSSADATVSPHEVEAALNRAAGYLRRLLGQRVNLRTTPGLRFEYDHSIRRGMEMDALIAKLNRGVTPP